MYELLLLDADGTILDYKASERFALENAFKTLGTDLDFETVLPLYCTINAGVWLDFEAGRISSTVLRWLRFEKLFEALGIEADPQKFAQAYLEFFGSTGFILPSTHEVLTYLQSKYTLALITNGLMDVQYSRLDNADIRKYFSTIIVSDEVGAQKPDPAIFDILFEQSGHKEKKTSLIIGDGLSSDIAGGIGYGIDTCWINLEKQDNDSPYTPTYEITELEKLFDLL